MLLESLSCWASGSRFMGSILVQDCPTQLTIEIYLIIGRADSSTWIWQNCVQGFGPRSWYSVISAIQLPISFASKNLLRLRQSSTILTFTPPPPLRLRCSTLTKNIAFHEYIATSTIL